MHDSTSCLNQQLFHLQVKYVAEFSSTSTHLQENDNQVTNQKWDQVTGPESRGGYNQQETWRGRAEGVKVAINKEFCRARGGPPRTFAAPVTYNRRNYLLRFVVCGNTCNCGILMPALNLPHLPRKINVTTDTPDNQNLIFDCSF